MTRYFLQMIFRWQKILMIGLLVVLTFGVYAQLISHEFISYDDPYYITRNPMIKKGLTAETFGWALTTFRAGFWIPLTWISFLVDYELFGLSAGGYLYVNLFFHILNTLLVFFLLWRLTQAPWRSFLVALMFGIHPLHVESVAWAVERKDVLSTFFFFCAIGLYYFYQKSPKPYLYCLLTVFFVLSLMAKPMYVTLPLALLLLDYWPLDRWQSGFTGKRQRNLFAADSIFYPFVEKIPLLLISGFFSVFNILIARKTDIFTSVQALSLSDRLANAVVCYAAYLKKFFWPAKLGVLYPHPGGNLEFSAIALAAVMLALITFIVLAAGKRQRYLPFGWFWFLIVLLPVSGLLQNGHQAMADRFVYGAVLGVMVIGIWGGYALIGKLKLSATAGFLIAAGILLILLARTHDQVNYWENSLSLYTRTLAVTEDNYLMHDYAGVQLIQQGRIDQAYRHFKKAIAIKPDYPDAYFNAGSYLMIHGRLEKAIACFKRSIKLGLDGENLHRAKKNLKKVRRARKNPAELVRLLEKTLALKPDDKAIQRSLDEVYKKIRSEE